MVFLAPPLSEDLLADVVVEREVGDGGAALLAHLRMLRVELHAAHGELDPAGVRDRAACKRGAGTTAGYALVKKGVETCLDWSNINALRELGIEWLYPLCCT